MTWKRLAGDAVLLLGILGLIACDARYQDVSNDSRYAEWIGQRCVVVNGLWAYGYTLNLNKRPKVTDGVDVTTVQIGGPEITFKLPIRKGSTFVVTSIQRCTNCPFGRIQYGIEIESRELSAYKVFARSEVLTPEQTQCAQPQRSPIDR